jgi:hypothetical protein
LDWPGPDGKDVSDPSPSYSAHGRDSLAGVAQAADFV